MSARALSARLAYLVVEKSNSLSQLLDQELVNCPAKDRALAQEISYGIIRLLPRLDFWARQLMDKPLKGKYRQGHFLILAGLYQLFYMRIPAHAAVGETVQASRELKLGNFSKLFNGVLRQADRQRESLLEQLAQQPTLQACHPNWLIEKIQAHYPVEATTILQANNERAPMWLRVNQQHYTRDEYQQLLAENELEAQASDLAPQALRLENPVNVHRLPGFETGSVSVQDAAAQMAAQLLDAQPGEVILDACAAPGGKTCHLLECQPTLQLTAIDIDEHRLQRVRENLARLQLNADVLAADASQPEQWAQQPFDRILLDAPCSATGVIRRHPDIKWLRRADDITSLAHLQWQILNALWQWLKPGGTLLYATCSILKEENSQQISRFLTETADAQLLAIHDDETVQQPGWQILPGQQQMDGFYYARLFKRPA
ncbi:16S rRNA (cytosine(967)-C(5))-methyltransferase RsmB [Celerinatantimonas sp. YJH-8]|uniref:16S rRNA (cytosine(967)-C(5))-methyltransferase RsmB n=1 Tax=Celerinatantimonas sp. YJH-8 TaxID=3228714 RepID=UPI0038C7C9AE